jgi:hypothetical protein
LKGEIYKWAIDFAPMMVFPKKDMAVRGFNQCMGRTDKNDPPLVMFIVEFTAISSIPKLGFSPKQGFFPHL